tara:strand:- start:208 stop:927 length:720 start_codon:yes stop_codon:yes gene_type:complete
MERCKRGKIDVRIKYSFKNNSIVDISVDKIIAYKENFNEIATILNIKEQSIDINSLLKNNEYFIYNKNFEKKYKNCIIKCFEKSLDDLDKYRFKEGRNILKDISKRISFINKKINNLKKISNSRIKLKTKNYKQKVKKILDKQDYLNNENRIMSEIVLISDKLDISEETSRLKSHIDLFYNFIEVNNLEKGKKINFLLQEINRELNTIGAKSETNQISHLVINFKNEIEKIREQVQNIL